MNPTREEALFEAALSNDEFFDPNRLLEVQITLPAEDFEKLRHQKRDLSEQFSQRRGEQAQPLPRAYDWFKGGLSGFHWWIVVKKFWRAGILAQNIDV